jgi:hypothetical protein
MIKAILAVLLALVGISDAKLPVLKWGAWQFISEKGGVTVEYRMSAYGEKTAVQWKARNNTGQAVKVELLKTYLGSGGTVSRKDVTQSLASGKVFDPSPDFIPGRVAEVRLDLRVSPVGEPKKKEAAATNNVEWEKERRPDPAWFERKTNQPVYSMSQPEFEKLKGDYEQILGSPHFDMAMVAPKPGESKSIATIRGTAEKPLFFWYGSVGDQPLFKIGPNEYEYLAWYLGDGTVECTTINYKDDALHINVLTSKPPEDRIQTQQFVFKKVPKPKPAPKKSSEGYLIVK